SGVGTCADPWGRTCAAPTEGRMRPSGVGRMRPTRQHQRRRSAALAQAGRMPPRYFLQAASACLRAGELSGNPDLATNSSHTSRAACLTAVVLPSPTLLHASSSLAFAEAGRVLSACSRRWHSAAAFFSSGEDGAGAAPVVAVAPVAGPELVVGAVPVAGFVDGPRGRPAEGRTLQPDGGATAQPFTEWKAPSVPGSVGVNGWNLYGLLTSKPAFSAAFGSAKGSSAST